MKSYRFSTSFFPEKERVFDAILIGAAALQIMGVVKRETMDFDILDPKIPKKIKTRL